MSETSKEVGHVRGNDLIFSTEAFEKMNSLANLMAEGTITTPKHLQGKPADCFAIVLQSMQWQLNPFVVAQKTHIVNGTLGYEAQLVNAVVQSSGLVQGLPKYEYKGSGEQLECRVAFMPAGQTEYVWNEWLMLSQIKTRNSPLWATNPKQQLGYLQIKNWARANTPGAILGVYSTDELQDSTAPEKIINPDPNATPVDDVKWYDQADFDKKFPKWEGAVISGTAKKENWISSFEAKGGKLTDEMLRRINEVKEPIEGEIVQ